jgi:hypothetical protein
MATSAPAGPPLGPGQVPGEGGGGGGGEAVGEPLKGQLSSGPTAPVSEQSGPSQIMKSQFPVDPTPYGGQPVQVGPQVSVAGHVQHVSVAGQVQQAGPGGEVIVSGGNGGVPPGGDDGDLPQKRKATSFKITNVFLSRPPSNDGDDSCDDNEDLEDSHTEGANVANDKSVPPVKVATGLMTHYATSYESPAPQNCFFLVS